GEPIDEVLELQEAAHFGDDRVGVRIPGGHDLTAGNARAFLDADHRAVRNLVALALAAEFIDDADLTGAGHCDQMALVVLHGLDVMETDFALVAHIDAAGRSGPGGS